MLSHLHCMLHGLQEHIIGREGVQLIQWRNNVIATLSLGKFSVYFP